MAYLHTDPNTSSYALQDTLQTHAHCANTRYVFSGCTHICLQRCKVHPVHPESLENTCPDPRAGFIAIDSQGSCPLCASQPELRAEIARLEDKIEQLDKAAVENLAGRREKGGMHCAMKGEVIRAETQRCKEGLKLARRAFDDSGGGQGLGVLGKKDWIWYPTEATDLWGWGLDTRWG